MATPLTDKINALTAYANGVTGESDTTLSEAVHTLADGYGQGWGDGERIPDDGKMHIWVDIPTGAGGSALNMPLRWTQTVSQGVEVDWGDKTGPVTYSGTGAANRFHKYAKGGKYEITLSLLHGEIAFDSSGATSSAWDGIYGSGGDIGYYWRNRIIGIYCPYEITTIDTRYFSSMANLRFLLFPNAKTTSLGQYCLYSLYTLDALDLGDLSGLTKIPFCALYCAYSLTRITVPENVTEIEEYAFAYCVAMKRITLKPKTPPSLANINAFGSIPSDCLIHVPYSSDGSIINAYKTATNWRSYASRIVQEDPPT